MPENFQQTVDLRQPAEKRASAPRRASALKPAVPPAASPIEKIYRSEPADEPLPEMKKFDRPREREAPGGRIKPLVFLLAIILAGAAVYWLFFKAGAPADLKSKNWYAVKLVDGAIYYGQILDARAEPVVINNAYYNYDQAKASADAKSQTKTIEEAGNIRLVKRGKETQGGDGTMMAYHVNILLMEALRPDSKVLQAILEYEK